MSSSTERKQCARWLRAAGAVVLAVVQASALWAYRSDADREAALSRPGTAAPLRWSLDATGTVEFHGDQAFAVGNEGGLEMVRFGPDTIVLAGTKRASPSILRPGVLVSVWGRAVGPRVTVARVILAWVIER